MLNQAGTTFTTAMLIADTYQPSLNSSVDSIPPFTQVNGFQISAALELQSTEGVFANARLTNSEQALLNVYKGMQMYNNDIDAIQFYYGGAVNDWVTPLSEIGSGIENDIVVFGASAGTIQDSGVKILLDLNNLNYYTGVLTGNANFTAMNSFAQGINVINDITTSQNVYASGISVLDEIQDNCSGNVALGIRCAINLIDGTDNFFGGYNVFALANSGSQNVLLGNNVLAALNDPDDNDGNACVGYNIGATAVAASQTSAFGWGIGQSTAIMGGCSFFGYGIASQAVGGDLIDLTAMGAFALQSITTGAARLTALGWSSLQAATTAVRCTAVGYQSAANLTVSATASDTTVVGNAALILATTGIQTTVLGSQSGDSQLQYTGCTFIGYNADADENNLTNATAIGAGATVSQSNSMILGAAGTQIGINTSTPVANFHNNGSEAAKYVIKQNSDLPYTVASDDNVIICYPSGNKVVTIPDSGPTNQGLMYKFVNLAGNGGDNITVQTTSSQPIDTNNTLGPSFTKTFMAIYTPFLSPVYRWAVVAGNDESP